MRKALCVVVLLGPLAAFAHGATFVVAPSGNDANPGKKEQPLATLEAARDAARKAGAGPHRIVVMPGAYSLTKTFELDARDNGLTIEAAEEGKTTLYGGTLVSGWRRGSERRDDLPLQYEEGTRHLENRRIVVDRGRRGDNRERPQGR